MELRKVVPGTKVKCKSKILNPYFTVSLIDYDENKYYLKQEDTGVIINFFGTEEELLGRYEIVNYQELANKIMRSLDDSGDVLQIIPINFDAKSYEKAYVELTESGKMSENIEKFINDIEKQGNIDRLLAAREYETLKNYLS